MRILWNYLQPYRGQTILSLALAGISQVLTLIDPIIFGKLIDEYATNPGNKSENDLITGALALLLLAVALLARLAKAFQEYLTRLVVQKFGMQIFNDGLRQTLRLSYQEFEGQSSGETLSILQKVRTETERFINSFINILFSSLVGMGFLVWYSVTKHWALVPVFVIGVLVLGGLTVLLSKKIKTLQRSINRETNHMAGVITESLRNIELVKSLGLTFPEIKRLREQTLRIFHLEIAKVKQVRTLSFLQGTTLNLLIVYLKNRPVQSRFKSKNSKCVITPTEQVFSKTEADKIIEFCGLMGLDYGELDILRDRDEGKMYIVDVNNTPGGPPNGLSRMNEIRALRKLTTAFIENFVERTPSAPLKMEMLQK